MLIPLTQPIYFRITKPPLTLRRFFVVLFSLYTNKKIVFFSNKSIHFFKLYSFSIFSFLQKKASTTESTATNVVVAAATPTIVSSAVVPSTTPSVAPTVLIATATPPPITPSAPKIIKIVNNGAVVAAGAVVATAKPVGTAAATTTPTAAAITSTAAATPTAVASANSADVKNQLIQKVMANNKLKQKLQQLKPTATAATVESTDKNDDADGNAAASAKPDSFVVTPDYIQQSNFLFILLILK